MPLYDNDFEPWRQTARTISAGLAQLPMARAHAAEQQARQQLYGAQVGTEQAQAEHYRAQTAKVNQETAGLVATSDLDKRMGDAFARLQANPNDTAALGDAFKAAGEGFHKEPAKTMQGVRSLVSMLSTMGGKPVQTAAALEDPNKVYAADQTLAGNKYDADTRKATALETPMNVPANDVVIDKRTGQPVAYGMAKLGVGDRLYHMKPNVGYDLAAEGIPPQPKDSAVNTVDRRFIADALQYATTPQSAKEAGDKINAYRMFTGWTPPWAKTNTPAPAKQAPAPKPTPQVQPVTLNGKPAQSPPWPQQEQTGPDPEALRNEAQAAIANGKDPAAVAQRFKDITGLDL